MQSVTSILTPGTQAGALIWKVPQHYSDGCMQPQAMLMWLRFRHAASCCSASG